MSKLLYHKAGIKNSTLNQFELVTPDIITKNNNPTLLYNHFKNNKYLHQMNIDESHVLFHNSTSIFVKYGGQTSVAMEYIFPKCPTKLTLNLYADVTQELMFAFHIKLRNTRLNKEYSLYLIDDAWTDAGGNEYRMEKLYRGQNVFSINYEEIVLDLKTFLDYENTYEDEHILSIISAQNVIGYSVHCAVLRKFILDF